MARHRTQVDDRLDQPKPSLRLLMRPWQAPFANGTEGAGAVLEIVLEIVLDQGPAPTVAGQFWIDSPSAAPTHLARIDAKRLTGAWVDRLLLDFVERALRGG